MDLWRQLAGATAVPQLTGDVPAVRFRRGRWDLRVEAAGFDGRSVLVQAPLRRVAPFDLHLVDERGLARLGKWLGAQDIEIGDDDVDAAFVLRSSTPDRVAAVLGHPALRAALLARDEVDLQVARPERTLTLGELPAGHQILDQGAYDLLPGEVSVVTLRCAPATAADAEASLALVGHVLAALLSAGLARPVGI